MNKYKLLSFSAILFLIVGGFILASAYKQPSSDIAKNKSLVVTGQCDPIHQKCEILGDSDIRLNLQFKAPPSYQRLLPVILNSETSLTLVTISLIINGEKMPPQAMQQVADDKHWATNIMPNTSVSNNSLKVQLQVLSDAALYSAEFPIMYQP